MNNRSFKCDGSGRIVAAMAAATVGLLLASSATASIYGTAADLTGLRTVGNPGLVVNDADWNDGKLEWSIVNNGNGTFTYSYTLTDFNRPAISHFTLDITDDAVNDPQVITDVKRDGVSAGPIEIGNKDGITGAVKFDFGDEEEVVETGLITYSFTSNRSPVWGDFILKAGPNANPSTAMNSGFGNQTLTNELHYVARPNGPDGGEIPEAATIVVWTVLIGLAVGGRRFVQ